MTFRPDEMASIAEQERNRKFDTNIKSGVKTAANLGLTAAGLGLTSRLMPFLNEHIPVDLAVKGISKLSPKLGEFLQKGASMGLNVEEGLQFIKDKLQPPKEEAEKDNKPQQLNELGQFSPELQTYIEQQIQGGKSPDHAAALAMNQPEFSDLTTGIQKKVNMPFTKFVRELYEGKAVQKPQQQAEGQQVQISPKLQASLQKLGKFLGG